MITLEALNAQPPELSPVAAFAGRGARPSLAVMTDEDKERLRENAQLTAQVPEIRARALDEFTRTIEGIAEALAARVGRPPDDFAVRTLAGAIIGVIMSATLPALTGEDVEITAPGLGPVEGSTRRWRSFEAGTAAVVLPLWLLRRGFPECCAFILAMLAPGGREASHTQGGKSDASRYRRRHPAAARGSRRPMPRSRRTARCWA